MEQNKSVENSVNDKNKGKTAVISVIVGVVTGLINGLFGGGGGMITVPMLTYLLKKDPKKSHATAILIILPISIVSGLFYASFANMYFGVLIPVLVGVIGGGIIGALLLKKITSKWLTVIFSVVMAVAGVKMLFF